MTPETNELLRDVLAEATPTEFEAAALSAMIRTGRRRRRIRQLRRIGIVAAVLLGFATATRYGAVRRPAMAVTPPYAVVETRPFPENQVVHTGQFGAVAVVAKPEPVAVVHTARRGEFRLINDEELLALAGAHHPVLVRVGPGEAKLILTDPPL